MNLFQLECFLALSHSLNFTQTAEELFVTQPTLSRNIASLEKELGTRLLVRNTKSVELTAAGVSFAKCSAELIDRAGRGVEEAHLAQEGQIGRLKLGIQQDAFEPFAVDLVRQFRNEYPRIELLIRPYPLRKLQDGVSNGKLDLIIGSGENTLEHPGRLLLSERAECAVLCSGHPLAERNSLRMEELRGERFIAMSPTASSSGNYLLQRYANSAGFSPNIVATAESVTALMMLVACGLGVSVLYRDLEQSAYGRLRFIPLENTDSFKRYLVWDQDNQNPAIESFLRCAKGSKQSDPIPSEDI